MLIRLSAGLYRRSTARVALAAVLLFLLFAVTLLPGQSSRAKEAARGAGSADTSLFYTPADLYRQAEAYGPAGRAEYVRARWTFDLAFPLVYTLFLATAVSWLYGRLLAPGSPWRLANLVPLAGMLFDYLENTAASVVMLRYPAHTAVLDAVAPFFTALKWLFVGDCFALLLLGLAVGWWRQFRRHG